VTKYRERREAGEYAPPASSGDLEGMTKQELLDQAAKQHVEVQASMSKADILAAIKAAGA
jgi:branched-subunit amino acid aminotransferase/4-amino-4-deoxychorismate lyase